MLNFHTNTYYVSYTEKDEVIEILQHHPEYKGYELGVSIDDILEDIHNPEYQFPLWLMLEEEFQYHEDIIYLDNAYITSKDIAKNPNIVNCAELYTAVHSCQHTPQPLLQYLRQLDKTLIRMD
jgi:hypothetical protein